MDASDRSGASTNGADSPVLVIGGGISGVACARRLHDAGRPVRILERSHRVGGRMAVRTEQVARPEAEPRPHPVDIGAPYFTVRDDAFAQVVAEWERAGRARQWTDTFTTLDRSSPEGRIGTTTGPLRWSSPTGLRSLVESLADGLDVSFKHEVVTVVRDADGLARVDGEPAAAVVLAMPDPQAARLLSPPLADELGVSGRPWAPTIAVWAGWAQRWWPQFDATFVAGSTVLSWVADSGRSHGDGAAVLCAHTTAAFAESRLDQPDSAIPHVLAELASVLTELSGVLGKGPGVLGEGSGVLGEGSGVLGEGSGVLGEGPGVPADRPRGGAGGLMPAPQWSRAHRWTFASPRDPHSDSFALTPSSDASPYAAPIGVCGDAWGQRSRVEQAWLSGDRLGQRLVELLGERGR